MRLAMTLERDESTEVFEVLAADLAEVASDSSSALSAIPAVLRRLEAWQACLRAHRRGLSREEEVGLFGELECLRILAEEIGFPQAVASWQGPLDGLHDFSRGGTALETKTALGPSSQIRISRLDQLETGGLSHLVVIRPRLRESPEGHTVADLVASLRVEIARIAPNVRSDFDELLLRAGWREANPDAEVLVRAEVEGVSIYEVLDGFPRLTLAGVPAGIVDGSYLIDERAVAPFSLDRSRASIENYGGGPW